MPSRVGICYCSLTEDDLHMYYNPETDNVQPWTCVTYNSLTKVLIDQFGHQQTMRAAGPLSFNGEGLLKFGHGALVTGEVGSR